MKIKKGQIVAITSGEFSGYCLRDHMRALRDFDPREEAGRFKREGDYLVQQRGGGMAPHGAEDRFIAWMTREGLLAPMDDEAVVELYIGDYGELNIGGNE